MSFDWEQLLELAEYMFDHADHFPDKEACYRAVASRAYYSVFCLTRNYVRHSDGEVIETHIALQKHLTKNRSNKNRSKVGNQLKRLHQIRKKADYDDDLHEPAVNTAKQALTQARKVREGLGQLLP